jgi:thiol:disulfide interchange protein
MKRITYILLPLLLLAFQAVSQVYDPVKWKFDHKLVGDDQAKLTFSATIEDKWHVYSTKLADDLGPVPSAVDFFEIEGAELVGDLKESDTHTEFDPVFQAKLTWFENKAVITQMVKLTAATAKITGELTYMTCDDSKCLPPDYLEFEFDIEAAIKPASKPAKAEPIKPVSIEQSKIEPAKEVVESAAINEHKSDEPEIFTPVAWSFALIEKGDGIYTLVATATIDDHWHVYSKDLPSEDGPIATEFVFLEGSYELVGDIREKGELIQEYDPNFMMDLSYYSNKMIMEQDFKINGAKNVKGEIYFMTCDAEKCLPPESIEFEINAKDGKLVGGEASATEATDEAPAVNGDSDEESTSLGIIFLLCLLGGFGALITPCVFPMIPMTVSFFTKQSKTKAEGIKKGVLYGVFIVLTYTALSIPFHIFSQISPDIFNEISTSPTLNIIFFIVFIVFAFSFLGAFELTMPNSLVNKMDKSSDKGGVIGIFFMAVVLILVSFSCTGPLLGGLLGSVLSSDGGASALTAGLAGFGVGLGFPFALFAIFPGWMNSLPKSGGWLNVVKVSFGFLELAFAFKFLSNADLVIQAGLLHRELFIAIWVGVMIAWAMYLFGVFRMPHDSPIEFISVGRGVLATSVLIFAIYLIPGLWGAPLKLISGFPPPMFYSESPNGFGGGGGNVSHAIGNEAIPEGADPSHCPHNLNCFHDYEQGMAYAKKVNKPVLLDFTGWACVNCRRMEETVWSDPRVLDILSGDVVLISLYVDEKTKLPKEEQYESKTTGKKIKTVGNKWADFQIKHFQSNSQPQYVIINHEEIKPLNGTAAYDPDIDLYIKWLETGVKAFEAGK